LHNKGTLKSYVGLILETGNSTEEIRCSIVIIW